MVAAYLFFFLEKVTPLNPTTGIHIPSHLVVPDD